MKKCTDFEKIILERQTSRELENHLKTCRHCTDLKNQVEQFQLPRAETDNISVPEILDDAIRTAARNALSKKRIIRFPSCLLKIAVSAAACVLIGCGIVFFSFSNPEVSQKKEVASVPENNGADLWDSHLENAVVDLALDMELGGEIQLLALSDQSKTIYDSNEYELF